MGFVVEEVDEVGPVGFLGHGLVSEAGGKEALPGLIYSTLHYMQVYVECLGNLASSPAQSRMGLNNRETEAFRLQTAGIALASSRPATTTARRLGPSCPTFRTGRNQP